MNATIKYQTLCNFRQRMNWFELENEILEALLLAVSFKLMFWPSFFYLFILKNTLNFI